MKLTSIRQQVATLFVGMTVLFSLIYFGMTTVVAFVVEDKIIASLLELEEQRIVEGYRKTKTIPLPSQDLFTIFQNIDQVPDEFKAVIEQIDRDRELFTPDEKHYHFRVIDLSHQDKVDQDNDDQSKDDQSKGDQSKGDQSKAYLIAEVSPLLAVTNNPQFVFLFVGGAMFTLMLAVVSAYWLSRKLTAPVIELAAKVEALAHSESKYSTIEELNQTLESWPQADFELGNLTERLKHLYVTLEEALIREKDFTTDVGHELRTPLTVISNALELVELRGYRESDLALIKSSVEEMTQTIQILLAIARSEFIEKESVELLSFLDNEVLDFKRKHKLKDFNVSMRVPEMVEVSCNQTLFSLLCKNLLENALKHSSELKLDIEWLDRRLIFSNQTDMNESHDALASPGITTKPESGVGQGLYLVQRIAESQGWNCQLSTQNKQFKLTIVMNG